MYVTGKRIVLQFLQVTTTLKSLYTLVTHGKRTPDIHKIINTVALWLSDPQLSILSIIQNYIQKILKQVLRLYRYDFFDSIPIPIILTYYRYLDSSQPIL